MNTCQLGNSSSATLALQLNFFQRKQNKKKFKNSSFIFFYCRRKQDGRDENSSKNGHWWSMSNADRRALEKLSLVDVVQEKCSGVDHTALFLVNVDQ